jgi:hypothetical protein
MAHKYEHVSTGGGFKVRNSEVDTTVINQNGTVATVINAYVPTADGTGTGVITPGTQIATVTPANAAHWVTLPAPVIGTKITLVSTNATGYEIRTSDPATIGINGGVGAGAESAITGAIGTMVELLCVSATNWIAWSRVAAGTLSVVQVAAA